MSAKLVSQRSQQTQVFAKFLVQNMNWELIQITTQINSGTHPTNMLWIIFPNRNTSDCWTLIKSDWEKQSEENTQLFEFSTKIRGTNLNIFWVYIKWIFKTLPVTKFYFLLVCVHLSNWDQKLVVFYQQSFQPVLRDLLHETCFLVLLQNF